MAARFSPASGLATMSLSRLLTQQNPEAVHVHGNYGQSKSLDNPSGPLARTRSRPRCSRLLVADSIADADGALPQMFYLISAVGAEKNYGKLLMLKH